MSDYKDYDGGAKAYDSHRSAFGAEEILDNIVNITGKDKSDVHVLDAGCGTGNYSLALLQAGIGKVSLFDASNGMLDLAKNKIDKYQRDGKIGGIKQCVLPRIPFEDESFDVVMINQVLHHLKVDDQDERTKVVSSVFGEAARVLKHGGVLLITTCFPKQYYGFWYTNIVPEVTRRCESRLDSRENLITMLTESGFLKVDFQNILGHNWAHNYSDPEGPLKPEWRNIDSYWAMFTEDELQTAIKRVEDMKTAGTLNQFMLDNDKSMTEGIILLVKAIKQ